MKLSTLSSLFVLLSVVSLIAIAPSAFAAHHEITITNAPGSETPGCEPDCFIPSTATVEVGAIVTWDNTDGGAAHTASAGNPTDGPSGVWDSSLIMAGQSFSYTADTAGTFDYYCMVHPWMEGTLIVEEAGAADAAAAEAAAAAAAAADAAAADAAAAAEADAAAEAAEAEAAAETAEAEAAAAAAIAALEAQQAAEAAEAAEAEAAAAAAAVVMAAPRDPALDLVKTLVYNISGGSVSSIITNSDDATLVVALDATDDGELSIKMDGNYITAFDDDSYFVLVNNEEVWFSQDGSTLTIPFEAGTEKIEIVGSAVVPEFGTIAMVVLAVAIISIIVITAKTKTQLIPKL